MFAAKGFIVMICCISMSFDEIRGNVQILQRNAGKHDPGNISIFINGYNTGNICIFCRFEVQENIGTADQLLQSPNHFDEPQRSGEKIVSVSNPEARPADENIQLHFRSINIHPTRSANRRINNRKFRDNRKYKTPSRNAKTTQEISTSTLKSETVQSADTALLSFLSEKETQALALAPKDGSTLPPWMHETSSHPQPFKISHDI